jgi:hypothetical protein
MHDDTAKCLMAAGSAAAAAGRLAGAACHVREVHAHLTLQLSCSLRETKPMQGSQQLQGASHAQSATNCTVGAD